MVDLLAILQSKSLLLVSLKEIEAGKLRLVRAVSQTHGMWHAFVKPEKINMFCLEEI